MRCQCDTEMPLGLALQHVKANIHRVTFQRLFMVSDHLKKIVLSLEFDVLEIALAHPPPPAPRLFAKLNVKMKSFANVRATFFFSVFKKNKGLKIIMSFRCVTE